jgi:hypothetical protein
MLICITENMNPNYNIIPCFVEKNPKQNLKYVLYQNKICGFLPQVPPANAPPNSSKDSNVNLKVKNNGRRRNWDALPNLQHFRGKRGVLELQDGD